MVIEFSVDRNVLLMLSLAPFTLNTNKMTLMASRANKMVKNKVIGCIIYDYKSTRFLILNDEMHKIVAKTHIFVVYAVIRLIF